jgi:AMIN domain
MGKFNLILAVILSVLIGASSWCMADEPANVLRKIRVVRSGELLGVEITADKDIVYTCSKMPSLLRVIVDLARTDPGEPETVYKVDSPMISSIRVEKKTINDVMVTRVSINLGENSDFAPLVDPADKKKLTIFLRKAALPQPSAPVAPASEPHVADKQPPEQPPAPTAATPPPVPVEKPAVQPHIQPVIVKGIALGADAIDIQAGATIRDFRSFTLREPGRLVIDIPAATSALRTIAVPENRFGITVVRIGRSGGKLRLVFDAGRKPFPGYRVTTTDTGLRVVPASP